MNQKLISLYKATAAKQAVLTQNIETKEIFVSRPKIQTTMTSLTV